MILIKRIFREVFETKFYLYSMNIVEIKKKNIHVNPSLWRFVVILPTTTTTTTKRGNGKYRSKDNVKFIDFPFQLSIFEIKIKCSSYNLFNLYLCVCDYTDRHYITCIRLAHIISISWPEYVTIYKGFSKPSVNQVFTSWKVCLKSSTKSFGFSINKKDCGKWRWGDRRLPLVIDWIYLTQPTTCLFKYIRINQSCGFSRDFKPLKLSQNYWSSDRNKIKAASYHM